MWISVDVYSKHNLTKSKSLGHFDVFEKLNDFDDFSRQEGEIDVSNLRHDDKSTYHQTFLASTRSSSTF